MRVMLGLAFLVLASGPAFAQADCERPIAPVAPDGHKATPDQMAAAIADAKRFIAQSDIYQQCLVDYVNAQKKKAQDDKTPFDKFLEADITKRINENQADKVQVGQDINSAVAVFKASHPQ